MMRNTTIKLDYPVEIAGSLPIVSLEMRRPKVKDQLAASKYCKDEVEQEIYLFALLTDQSTDVIKELDLADYKRFQKALTDFFPRPSSDKSS